MVAVISALYTSVGSFLIPWMVRFLSLREIIPYPGHPTKRVNSHTDVNQESKDKQSFRDVEDVYSRLQRAGFGEQPRVSWKLLGLSSSHSLFIACE